MPLGHMLTFKVAYQIAAGLAYLHRKSIIFCDLKSDNILVWSLEVCMWNMHCFFSFCEILIHHSISPDLSVNLFKLLLWLFFFSLQKRDSVNIKLSDYGISRQSFHEGVLGVEGTPGYQAPEVRPGIVYDEKVLMASAHPSNFHFCQFVNCLFPLTMAVGVRPPTSVHTCTLNTTQCWTVSQQPLGTAESFLLS